MFAFYHFLTFSALGTDFKLIWIELSRCNFDDIEPITDIGTIGIISFENFATTQIITNKDTNKDNFYLLQNNTNKEYNVNIYK